MMKKLLVMALITGLAVSGWKATPSRAEDNVAENAAGIVSLETDEEEYVFKSNGYVKMLNVYGVTEDGSKVDLNGEVTYQSEDESIATTYDDGMVRAESKGSTNVLVEYCGIQLNVPVSVESEIDLEALEQSLMEEVKHTASRANTAGVNSASSTRTAQEILDKASAMKNVVWTPEKELVAWKDSKNPWKAKTQYQGIPYSQATQVDEITFMEKLRDATNTDFYVPDKSPDGIQCPRYGVDCFGYVSFALGTSQMTSDDMVGYLKNGTGPITKVGSYDAKSPTKTALYSAYKELQAGNALVCDDHAKLVLSNSTSSEQIVVYETKDRSPMVSIYEYSDLWNNGSNSYLPFKLK